MTLVTFAHGTFPLTRKLIFTNGLSGAMSDENILKCPCKECGKDIEYPESSGGNTIACPHCSQWTELLSAEEEPEDDPKKSFNLGRLAIYLWLLLLLAMVVCGYIYFHRPAISSKQTQSEASRTNALLQPANHIQATAMTNAAVPFAPTNDTAVGIQTNVVAEKRPKSSTDLKVGAIKLEKTPGSSLVHAIGTIRNDSDYERFGISIALDLIDVKGARIGSTRDYKDLIEPHKSWQFNALVTDKKAVAAVVNSLKEEQ